MTEGFRRSLVPAEALGGERFSDRAANGGGGEEGSSKVGADIKGDAMLTINGCLYQKATPIRGLEVDMGNIKKLEDFN